jgi:hypothetical protein
VSNPLGGNPPVPLNAPPPGSGTGTAAGASAGPLRVTEIIITPGSVLEGIFTYSSDPPAAGTLIESASVAAAGTDESGNHYLAGHATYAAVFATALDAGYVAFYTGSLSAGWTFAAQLLTDTGGDLIMSAAGGTLTLSAAGTLTASGNVAVTGSLTVNGSADTGTSGLPNGDISGSSGQINTGGGTAHTHGPGSYAVTDGMHNHVL